ncbi:MAG TPA: carboxypeptidase regulatory-like domain-containing protein, partial [Blastocatellia bacterium]|nr:carboxypeptidase regulatory-like domain-containing protein [Blastocatellia bacterium]
MPIRYRFIPLLLGFILSAATVALGDITGSVSGVVKDSSGALVTGASVVATNTQTGIKTQTRTDDKGFYSLPVLPVGNYLVEVQAQGFKAFKQTGVVVDANAALRIDVTLELGQVTEEVTVKSEAAHVETQNTQMGEVITAQKIESVPLNGRSYTDLLSLQPGVVPSAYSAAGSNTGSIGTGTPGLDDRAPSGNLNAGNQSVNGQRETSNGFMVNGANVEEGKNNGAAIVPNLDSIEEFRIITNNFDAQYGNYSGGQVNVVTKSGTNQWHGDVFEFLRNTALDARNFFSPTVPAFKQNQFGGVLGGPIQHDKGFFFIDYQGTRSIQGQTQVTAVPSLADRGGDLNDQSAFGSTVVNGSSWAGILSQRLGETVTAGEPYSQVFPTGIIPMRAFSPVAAKMLQFIPTPNGPNDTFTSVSNQRLNDDKGAARVDFNTRFGQLFGYYSIDQFTRNDPFPNGGANVPGFNALSDGRAQLWVFGVTTTFGGKMVNDFRFSVVRNVNLLFQPSGGLGTSLASLGFTTGFSQAGGIGPIVPQLEGVPQVAFANLGLTIGVPADTPDQFNNTFQWQDNVTRVFGTHTLTFGGQFHYDQINYRNLFGENGSFTFDGSETGSDIGDFLLGAPVQFIQASKQVLDSRSKYAGLYIQDSWRALSNLTFNYGLRWEMSQPWYDSQNKIETIVPGEQSVVFPTAPQGLVVPGDPGIPSTLAPTQHDAFSPRLGVAYSPGASSGFLAKLTGGPGKTSIRAGYGIFYTAIEDLSQFQEVGDPPYGLFYVSPNPPLFEAPYIDRASGNSEGQ